MSIISGLNAPCLSRLKWTLSKISKNHSLKLSSLESEMGLSSSMKLYREGLKNSIPPAIPYLGVHLQDLVFIEDGNPNLIRNLINWTKRKMVGNIVNTILIYQSDVYKFELKNPKEFQYWFHQFPILSEKELFEKSLKIEPRDSNLSDLK